MRYWHRAVIAGSAALSVAGLVLAGTPAASARPEATAPHLVQTTSEPVPTTNDKVDALTYSSEDHTLYASGLFTTVSYDGHTYSRDHLVAIDQATGGVESMAPVINGEVTAMALSYDKKILIVGGKFSSVDGVTRHNIAAFALPGGQLTSFAPDVTGVVHAIATASGEVYFGGTISAVNGQKRTDAAKASITGQLSTSWHPALDGWVRAMLISPDKTRVILGGGFHHVNGVAMEALGSVSTTTAANEPFVNGLIPTYPKSASGQLTLYSQVTSFSTDGTHVYAGAEGTGGGVFDGTLSFMPDTGQLVWRNTCLGATQGVLYLNGVLYKASHAHNCSSMGDFGQIEAGWQAHHLLAENAATGQLMTWGTSAESISQPLPDTNGGVDSHLGPYAFASDGRQLWVAGTFTTVNTKPQEGLARFYY